jgi:hypothetical protein
MVSNTSELLPEPETQVNTVGRRFGISTMTSFRLVSRRALHADQTVAVHDVRWWRPGVRSPGPSVFASERVRPQRTAFLTSAAIFFSSAGVNSSSAKEVGHILPSSRFAASWKPNVEYLDLY